MPVLWYLSGLTCTHENAMVKAGAQRWAAELGIALVFPDTSPRGEGVANDAAYDLGQGAGFYVNATQKPWAPHFRMWDYVTDELPRAVVQRLSAGRRGAGDHRAFDGRPWRADHRDELSGPLPPRFPPLRRSATRRPAIGAASSSPPIWARTRRPGRRMTRRLLMKKRGFDGPMLIDQGTADQFIDLLKPEALAAAMTERRQGGTLRMQKGYDHSYFFVSTFMEEHIAFHATALHG